MNGQTLGQRISEERKKLGLSQESLGEKIGVSRQAISKWESDGAIPEIDKLIFLSRLFGVSVGWLLGEEATPEQAQTSPTPIHTAKQTVKNHLADHPWWRTGCWIVIALCALFITWMSFLRLHRITNAEITLSIVQSDVDRLEHQVKQLEFLYEAADRSGTLLAGYNFGLALSPDKPEAAVTFTAAPRQWQEGDQAYFCVSGSGIQPLASLCQWDGDSLSATLTLPFADGYELSFVVVHPDGSRQLQLLQDSTLESLKTACAITSFGSVEESSWKRGENTLLLENFQYSCNRPDLYTESPVTWQKIQLVLYRNGEEIWQQTDFDAAIQHDSTLTTGGMGRRGTFRLDLSDARPEPGQTLELKLHTVLSNTVTAEALIASWSVDTHGIPKLHTPD